MSVLSRNNIAYDFNISPYSVTVVYGGCEIKYVFSSNMYKRNFQQRMQSNREKINQSLSNRFGFTINQDILSDLKLYITIEKRGFLLCKDGIKMECLNNLVLDGDNLMNKN